MVRRILAVAALLSASAASASWQEASSKHFVVYSNDAPERVRAFTARLEKFDKAIKVLHGVPEDGRGASARVTVYVVDDIDQIERLAGQSNVAGFYASRSSGATAFVPRRTGGTGASTDLNAQRILLHEYGHHFMYADWPSGIFPMWFSEGFAEFHSTAIFGDDGSMTFGAPPTDRGYGVTMVNQMPLSRMLRPDPGKMSDMETYALYSRGWLLTHYLTFEPERRKQLADYVSAINEGKTVEDAAKVFGNLNALDLKLTSYVKRRTFRSLTLPAAQLEIGAVAVRALDAGEAATMPARIRSNAGVSPRTAPQVATLARTLAQPYPNNAAAQNELAEAEYDAKNYAQAAAAADRALAADPRSVHAAIYKGMALQAIAEAAKSTDAAQWQAVRRWYVTANKIDPENPEPLILYYRSFKPANQQPSPSAEAGMLYGYALAPFDLGLRVEAGRILLKQGKTADARSALLPVAYSPHSGDTGRKVRDVVATLDKNGAAPALVALDTVINDAEKAAKDKEKG